MRVSVFGLGYVGSVLCACLAECGHDVVGVDVQQFKVDALNRGESPIVEPGLDALVKSAVVSGRVRGTTDPLDAVRSSELSLICVGTPSGQSGDVDLRALERVSTDIGRALRDVAHFHSVVLRSTVLPGTMRSIVLPILESESGKRAGQEFGIGYNPEFMREGSAVADFFAPPFTVASSVDPVTSQRLRQLYERIEAPFIELSFESAELLKSVCNTFHAMKVTFANEIGVLCASIGVNGTRLMEVFCRDTKLNLSSKYLRPGFAFGGSCLPKDLKALGWLAESQGIHVPLLRGILSSNEAHVRRAEELILATGKTRIGVLGLTFKVGTDDTRESPALMMTQTLLQKGCEIWAYEPDLDPERLIGANREYMAAMFPNFASRIVGSIREVTRRAEVLVVTKCDPRYTQLVSELEPAHVVIDLPGFFAGYTLPCPRIALC